MLLTRMDAPGPALEVFVNDALPGTEKITVFRSAGGRTHRVRGMIGVPYLGGVTVVDFEVPLDTPVEYRAQCFGAGGDSLGYTAVVSTTVESAGTWLHHPLVPSGAVQVLLLAGSGVGLSRPVESSVVFPQGRSVGVVVGSTRRGLTGFRLEVWTDTLEAADKVQALLGDDTTVLPPVLCIRVGGIESRMRIPKPLFLHVADLKETGYGIGLGEEDVMTEVEGAEVTPPTPALFIPLLTRDDVDAYYATRTALDRDNLTRSALDRRYDLAGWAHA